MFDFLLVAQALMIIDQYFEVKASDEDFWEAPDEVYQYLESDPEILCFMIDPKKLKRKYRASSEALIVTEHEKESLLKAFALLNKYSETLPASAHLSERLLIAKNYLPPIFFDSKPHHEGCKIIPFKKSTC